MDSIKMDPSSKAKSEEISSPKQTDPVSSANKKSQEQKVVEAIAASTLDKESTFSDEEKDAGKRILSSMKRNHFYNVAANIRLDKPENRCKNNAYLFILFASTFSGFELQPAPAKTFAEAIKEQTFTSWADLCDIDSDDEMTLLAEMNELLETKKSEKSLAGIYLPKNMEEVMPRWYNIISRACKFCKTELHKSNLMISAVNMPNIYSLDVDEWESAKNNARQNSKDQYSAYNVVSQILSFFSKPIDLEKNPTLGQGQLWVLNKVAYNWCRDTYKDDFDAEAFRIGTNGSGTRSMIVARMESLITRGDTGEIAEEITSALEHLLHKYIQRMYSKPAQGASGYMELIIQSVTRDGEKLLATKARKTIVIVREKDGTGKNAKMIERKKTSYTKPWVHKGDELWTPNERKALKIINEFMSKLPSKLDESFNRGPMFDYRSSELVISQMWEISDEFNSIAKKRKKEIRRSAVSKKAEKDKAGKITPDEWETAKKAIMESDSISRDLSAYIMLQGGSSEDAPSKLRALIEHIFEDLVDEAYEEYAHLLLNWDIFEKGVFLPEDYQEMHNLRVTELNARNASAGDDSSAIATTPEE